MKFIFYYDYKNLIGGLTSLYITIFEELVAQGCDFVFFNFEDGIVARELKKKGIKIEVIDIPTFDWKRLDKIISNDDILITTSFDEALNKLMKVNPKVFYYTVHEFIGDISKYRFGINSKKRGRELVARLEKEKSLLLMDDTGIRNSRDKLNYEMVNPLFLPIPVQVPGSKAYEVPAPSQTLQMSYVSRSVDWKMMPLKKILDDLYQHTQQGRIKIIFSVAVDSIWGLKQFINVEQYAGDNFELQLFENVAPTSLNEFLLRHSDLGFGMGTVALEYAKLGIPVILMDFSKSELPTNYHYQWLHQTQFFCLGKNINENSAVIEDGLSAQELIDEWVSNPHFLQSHSDRSYSYVSQNHGVDNFVKKLLAYSESCTFRLQSAVPYVLYYSSFHKMLKSLKG